MKPYYEGEGTTSTRFWMNYMRIKENFRMNGRKWRLSAAVTSDVHTCVAKWSISGEGTFLSKVNDKIVVKLNTGCVQNVVTTWRSGLGRPRLGTDAEDFVSGTGHTYPHLDEVHDL
jgi:hypothetical protein